MVALTHCLLTAITKWLHDAVQGDARRGSYFTIGGERMAMRTSIAFALSAVFE
jgi:hypothetical protein